MPTRTRFPFSAAVARAALPLGLCAVLNVFVPQMQAASMPHPHHEPHEIVRAIEKLEAQWQKAELHGDTNTMESMLSDDYLGIYADGTLATKTETLEDTKSGEIRFTRIDTSDRKIRVYGSTAVVVSRAEVQGTINGEDISGRYRYTRVYHRSNGVWKIVSFEASPMHEPHHGHATKA